MCPGTHSSILGEALTLKAESYLASEVSDAKAGLQTGWGWGTGRGPSPISQGTAAAGPLWPAFFFLGGNLFWKLLFSLRATGRASGMPVARGHLNSAEGTRDSYCGVARERDPCGRTAMGFLPFAGSEPDRPRG